MTLFIPLGSSSPCPQTPPFLTIASNPPAQLRKVIQSILKAKRIVVVCGAGISVQAGIPDFRSPRGLFQTLKRDNPREILASGKDLFDASVFNATHTTSLFCQMIAQLSRLSHDAEPTAFHHLLRTLDDHGKLLRVYTQNIDAIEQKTGLSFGLPEFKYRRGKNRSKGKATDNSLSKSMITPSDPTNSGSTRLPSPPAETPRCIPLHGTVQSLHCQICTYSFPLHDHLASLALGRPPSCPECTSSERIRRLIGKRPRGIGKLRPSVVLYNEEHKDGEGLGEMVRRDLMGSKGRSGADLLLVVGTSLRIPGTKRMVREFSKAVKLRMTKEKEDSTPTMSASFTRSSNCATVGEEQFPMKAVYLNLDFPVPTREWEGIFDVWLQGDVQHFAQLLRQELEIQAKVKELATEKKRKRDEEATFVVANTGSSQPFSASISAQITPKPEKRKVLKRRKVDVVSTVSPPPSPESPLTKSRHYGNFDFDVDVDIEDDMDVSSTSSLHFAGAASIGQRMIHVPSRGQCYANIPLMKTPRPHAHTQTTYQLPPTPEDTPPRHNRHKICRPDASPLSVRRTSITRLAPLPLSIDGLPSSTDAVGISLMEGETDDCNGSPASHTRSTQVRVS